MSASHSSVVASPGQVSAPPFPLVAGLRHLGGSFLGGSIWLFRRSAGSVARLATARRLCRFFGYRLVLSHPCPSAVHRVVFVYPS